jgi:hypothetical protein
MWVSSSNNITELLADLKLGDATALEHVIPLLFRGLTA